MRLLDRILRFLTPAPKQRVARFYWFGVRGKDHITWAEAPSPTGNQRVIGWCEHPPVVGDRLVTPTLNGALVEWRFVDIGPRDPNGGMFVGEIEKVTL